MKVKIVMNSGKEYTTNREIKSFLDEMYHTTYLMHGKESKALRNHFLLMDYGQNIYINPSHISSINFED